MSCQARYKVELNAEYKDKPYQYKSHVTNDVTVQLMGTDII